MVLYPSVKLIGKPDPEVRHVLVDDVFTTGGHVQAIAAALCGEKGKVTLVVTAGRTVHEQLADPFSPPDIECEEFDPDDPFA